MPSDTPSPAPDRPDASGVGRTRKRAWGLVEHLLLPVWALAALITMYPALGRSLHLSGTFFTSHAADLAFPAWFYIICRRRPAGAMLRWLGRSPAWTAIAIFVVGVLSEFAQRPVPHLLTGTFDPLDIAAYGVALSLCVIADPVAPATAPEPSRSGSPGGG